MVFLAKLLHSDRLWFFHLQNLHSGCSSLLVAKAFLSDNVFSLVWFGRGGMGCKVDWQLRAGSLAMSASAETKSANSANVGYLLFSLRVVAMTRFHL